MAALPNDIRLRVTLSSVKIRLLVSSSNKFRAYVYTVKISLGFHRRCSFIGLFSVDKQLRANTRNPVLNWAHFFQNTLIIVVIIIIVFKISTVGIQKRHSVNFLHLTAQCIIFEGIIFMLASCLL
jgi:hypothetical protein